MMTQKKTEVLLDATQRERLARLANLLIPGGHGLPSASEAEVHQAWVDRTLAVRPDLADAVVRVVTLDGDPDAEIKRLREQDKATFEHFAYAVAASYLMNPRVRQALGFPGGAPQPRLAFPDESEFYLTDGILDPVIKRGLIYRSTPTN